MYPLTMRSHLMFPNLRLQFSDNNTKLIIIQLQILLCLMLKSITKYKNFKRRFNCICKLLEDAVPAATRM